MSLFRVHAKDRWRKILFFYTSVSRNDIVVSWTGWISIWKGILGQRNQPSCRCNETIKGKDCWVNCLSSMPCVEIAFLLWALFLDWPSHVAWDCLSRDVLYNDSAFKLASADWICSFFCIWFPYVLNGFALILTCIPVANTGKQKFNCHKLRVFEQSKWNNEIR